MLLNSTQEWGIEEVKQLVLSIRALNYSVGKQQYTAVFITTLEGISSVSSALSGVGDEPVHTGVCICLDREKDGLFVTLMCYVIY